MVPERTQKSLDGLKELCQYLVPRLPRGAAIVEVGGWTGAGTGVFAYYFPYVYVVDPWDPGEGEIAAEENVREAEKLWDARHLDRLGVTKMKMRSVDAATRFPDKSLPAVYLDGLHAYPGVKADIEAWQPKIMAGGFLCGHDYETRFPGVLRAVDEKFKTIRTFPDTSWAVQL